MGNKKYSIRFCNVVFIVLLQLGHSVICVPPPIISGFTNEDIINHVKHLTPGQISSFSMSCNGLGQSTYKWFKDGSSINRTSRGISLLDHNKKIQFLNNDVDIVGYYYCEATNEAGIARSEVIFVTYDVTFRKGMIAPKLVLIPKTEIILFGDDAKFECKADGNPKPGVIWTKNGRVIDSTGKINIDRNNSLTIKNVDTGDIGTYACNASSSTGYDYRNVYLDILKTKPIIKNPGSQIAAIGNNVKFRFEVSGYPKPTIRCYHDGEQINSTHADYDSINQATGELILKGITKAAHGTFTCNATNIEGEKSAHTTLNIQNRIQIIEGPSNMKVEIGQNVTILCTTSYTQSPQSFSWQHDSRMIDLNNERFYRRNISSTSMELTIMNVTYHDTGTYTCVVSNSVDTDTDSGMITVVGTPPNVTSAGQVTIYENTNFTFNCTVEGYPLPTKSWRKIQTRRNYVNKAQLHLTKNNNLMITEAKKEDSGSYKCIGKNQYGTDRVIIKLHVIKEIEIISNAKHEVYAKGNNVSFDCNVKVDPMIKDKTSIVWYKTSGTCNEKQGCVEENQLKISRAQQKKYHLTNNTLTIFNTTDDDIDNYICQVIRPINPKSNKEKKLLVTHSLTRTKDRENRDIMNSDPLHKLHNVYLPIVVLVALVCLTLAVICYILKPKSVEKNVKTEKIQPSLTANGHHENSHFLSEHNDDYVYPNTSENIPLCSRVDQNRLQSTGDTENLVLDTSITIFDCKCTSSPPTIGTHPCFD